MPTNPQALQYPMVNQRRWSFSAVTFNANGVPLPGLASIDYSNELKGADVRASGSPLKVGSTRGDYMPTLSFDILAEEYENFIFQLCALNGTPGSGYMEVRFNLDIAKQDGQGLTTGPLYVDQARGVKLTKVSKGYKTGPEGLLTKCDCDVIYILENGQSPVTVNPGQAGNINLG